MRVPATLFRKTITRALLALFLSYAVGQTLPAQAHKEFLNRLSDAAIERTHHSVRYIAAYVRIPYPGGDVPADTGVCTDEVIRSYRALGIDLQKEVHEDMMKDFAAYPKKWAHSVIILTQTSTIGGCPI